MSANNLSYQFKSASIVIKLVVINSAIFLCFYLASFFFGISQAQLATWFVLPEDIGDLLLQPWSLVSYGFLHFGFWHLFWNMIVLVLF